MASSVCHLCRAHKNITRLWWTKFQRDSRIRDTHYSNKQIMGWLRGMRNPPAFIKILGFWFWRVWVDAMHTLDLGVYQFLVPSCLKELIKDRVVWEGANQRSRLLFGYRRYKEFCKKHKVKSKCRPFKVSALKKDGTARDWLQHNVLDFILGPI